ncbi:Acetyl xylan esterase (AXE1) [Paenibacillus sp. UNCCL117]|uniref:alpha/beta hydrolase family protein n=1 Tax=unclassified Paenibacillus TaxID=185978 RepID=UPI0008808BF8|nr:MULTISPECIES: acetylxylan esterase [unclassified Paenibacillus]SDC66795.1 Acetyl xylan esterase (AXE1) [Paenibacillus sp. cl123]SFW23153.1 Acetyl xylan esterase (AXE1) [Paenibacillus sp. UNCCL117]
MAQVNELERYICTLYDTRDQLKRHIYDRADRAFAAGDQARDRIAGPEQLKARQLEMKAAFLTAIGGLPETEAPLNARTAGRSEGSGYSVENVIFESRPGHYVTSNLYLPAQLEAPDAAVLFLCGHEYEAKHSPYYHEVCLRLVQAGLIVLALDPVGQGERLGFHEPGSAGGEAVWGTREHQYLGVKSHAVGESVARYFIHDAMRAVDYLCSRQEVDPARIGVTGNSGGGTQTAMLMMCDDRIAAAAPATFIMNRQMYMHAGGVQDAEQVWPGLTAAGFDHEDLLLSFAPKPLLVLAAEYDFFPIEATRRTVARSKRFWELLGREEGLRLTTDRSLHRFTDKLAVAAAAFFAEQLAGRHPSAAADREPLPPLPAGRLICTSSGQVREEFPDARSIDDEIIVQADELERTRGASSDDRMRQESLAWLREKIVSNRKPVGLSPRRVPMGRVDDVTAEYILWWSQEGLMNSGYVFQSTEAEDGAKQPVTVCVWRGGTGSLEAHWTWIRQTCGGGRTVLVLNSSGVGPHEPYPIYARPAHGFFGVIHKLADDLIWLGDSLAALRAYDVIRCLDLIGHLDEWQSGQVDFYTEGLQGIYVRLAAAVDERVGHIAEERPVKSVADQVRSRQYEEEDVMSVVLPGLLRYCDLPELREQSAGSESDV